MALRQKAMYNRNELDNGNRCGGDHFKVGLKFAIILANN